MRKTLFFSTILLMTATAFAFGGHGHGRKSASYSSGVDAIGVHYNTGRRTLSKKCPAHSHLIGGLCQCDEGYVSDLKGGCIENPCEQAGVRPAQDGSCTLCINGNVYLPYLDNPCSTTTNFDGCKSNDDCDEDEFCQLTQEWPCSSITGGVCADIGSYTEATVLGLGNVRRNNNPRTTTWLSANNWCNAQGRRLVTIEEIGCYDDNNTDNLIIEGSGRISHCCKEHAENCNEDWYNYWNDKTMTDESYVTARYNPTIISLRQAFGNSTLWTISDYSSTPSCNAFSVDLYDGDVGGGARSGPLYALCVCPKGYDGEDCDSCATGYTGDNCDTCDTGYTGDYCNICATGYEKWNGTCVLACTGHYTHNEETGTCDTCTTGYTGNSCNTCATGYESWNETCVLACEEHYTRNDLTGECECASGYEEWNGTCVAKCDRGYEHNSETGSCDTCAQGYEMLNELCFKKCPVGYNLNTETNECDTCAPNISRSTRDNSCSICDNGNVFLPYLSDPCSVSTQFTGCKSNDDCARYEYCNLTGTSDCYPDYGSCEQIGPAQHAGIEGLPVILNPTPTTEWAAWNWCKAQGKNLLDIDRFQCYQSGTNILVTEGTEYTGSCCAEGVSCYPYYSGEDQSKYSPIAMHLKQMLPEYPASLPVWTSSLYNQNNSCDMFGLNLNILRIEHATRNYYAGYALCVSCPDGYTGDYCNICATGYTGANCDTCDTGYTGDYCNICATGYEKWNERCVPVCGEHSSRNEETGACDICDTGYYPSAGECLENLCAEGLRPSERDGSCTICTNGNVYMSYYNNPCSTPTNFDGCKSNDDCDEDEFCNLTGYDNTKPTSGTCQALNSPDPVTVGGLGSVRKSSSKMTWWAADQWCKAQGMNLIDVRRFGCYKTNTNDLVTEGSGYVGGCCAEGEECGLAINLGWFQPGYKNSFSIVLYNLEQEFGNSISLWTSSYDFPNTFGSAYSILLTSANISGQSHNEESTTFALCGE